MPPRKQWDDEEDDASSSGSSSPPLPPTRRPNKFDDEEDDDGDVLDSWDAAEDSEVEREKAKKAAEAKAKADAEAAANKKSKAQRIAELKAERARALEASGDFGDEETEAERRARLRRTEKESDLAHAEELFGDAARPTRTISSSVVVDAKDPTNAVDLGAMSLFNPNTKTQFESLRNTLVPLISQHHKKAHYSLFLQEFAKQLAKELPSDQIKKIGSTLTTLSNEKLKEEKAAEKGGKKSKAQKSKVNLNRPVENDYTPYDGGDDFGDDDFM